MNEPAGCLLRCSARRRASRHPFEGPRPSRGGTLLFLGILCALVALPARPLDLDHHLTQFPLDHWQAEQGLPQSSVLGIAQTPEGYLWVSSEEGLARFDGVAFTVFDPENTPAVRSALIHTLCTTADGTLWYGTSGGGLGSMKKGAFRAYGAAEGMSSRFISALCPGPGPDDSLWVGTYGEGLFKCSPGGNPMFTHVPHLPDGLVVSLCARRDGGLWVAMNDGTVGLLNRESFTPLRGTSGAQPLGVLTVLEDGGGTLWLGTSGAGLLRQSPDGALETPAWASPLKRSGISALLEDRQGALWIGSVEGELHRFVRGRLETLGSRDGMPASPIRSLFEDPAGDLWIGTQTGGLLRLRSGRFTPFSTAEGLSSDYATGVLQSADGSLWIATHGGGLNRVNGAGLQVFRTADGLSSDQVFSLLEARDGTLWIGTDGGGLCTRRGGKISPFDLGGASVTRIVTSLYQDRAGAVWVGTNGDGLYSITEGRLKHFGRGEGLKSLVVHVILEDAHGALWVGTEEGLCRMEGGRVRVFTTLDGLPSDLVIALYEDQEGALWIGTAGGGLGVCAGGRLMTVSKADGLYDNAVMAVVPDGLGNLWMTCNRGIFRASRKALLERAEGRGGKVTCVAYGRSDGMKSSECNGAFTPSGIRLRDGRLCFPTVRGVVFVDPAAALVAQAPPRVLVEQITHDGISAPRADPFTLPRGVRHFEIHYTALGAFAPEQVRFRFLLEGYDRDWIEAGPQRVAYYTNIGPGRYRFRVTAADREGGWSPLGETVELVIPPRFYETGLFLWGSVLCLVLLAGLAYSVRVRNLRLRQRALEDAVARQTGELRAANVALGDRTRELEDLNQELARISAQDALTGLANRRHFEERLEQEWRRSGRNSAPMALISLDVDYFKDFNDAYGHPQGDVCLRALGNHLSASFARASDLPARLGGDEFSVLLAETGIEEASLQAEKLRMTFEALAIPNRASKIAGVVTLSIGVSAGIPGAGFEAETLLRAADQALYSAKAQGKNRSCALPLNCPPTSPAGPDQI